jgi:hypothetical protein
VLQKVGEFFRSLDPDVWVNAWKNSVLDTIGATIMSNVEILCGHRIEAVLVGDVRYPTELKAIHKMGGKVVRFTRTNAPGDQHESEIALDSFTLSTGGHVGSIFDAIVDNRNMSVEEQNDFVWDLIIKRGWLE